MTTSAAVMDANYTLISTALHKRPDTGCPSRRIAGQFVSEAVVEVRRDVFAGGIPQNGMVSGLILAPQGYGTAALDLALTLLSKSVQKFAIIFN